MRQFSTVRLRLFDHIIDHRAIRERLEFLDNNLFVIGSAVALLATFIFWINI